MAGSFTVYDATYDSNGKVLTFAAQFFQHCDGFYSQLMGNVSYNSAAQIPVLPATPPDVPQSAQLVSMPGDYPGEGQAYSYPIAYPLGETPNRQGPNRWELTSDPSNVVWDIEIAAANNAPLTVGTYLESTSDAVSLTGPQIMVGGLGKACTLQDGTFNIYDITYDAMGMLNSMAFEFAIQCIGSTGVLYGAIRWNSNVVMPALPAPQASIVATPAGLNFGNVRVGDYTDPDAVTLTNKGGANAVISSGGLTGSAADDYFGQSDCGTLAPLATCTIDFSFFPGAVGQRSATAIVDDGSSTPLLITLSGFGTEGYYEAASSGAVYAFGDAESYGDMSKAKLSTPIVNMTTTPGGFGYWLLGGDGGIFSFGDAQFYGSTGGITLNKSIVGMAPTPDGGGYWLVASDGGIFSFGDATYYGSTGGRALSAPIVGMAAAPDGVGYWLVASNGGVFAYGSAQYNGSEVGLATTNVVSLVATSPPTLEAQFDVPAARSHLTRNAARR